jgi:AraC-like DNA-binding protein
VLKAQRFYLDVQGLKRPGLTVVCGGCEHCEPDFCIDREDFPYYSIECVARGQGELVLAGKHYSLLAGTVFAYGPKTPHVITTHPKDRLVKYFVDFSGSKALSILREYELAPGTATHVHSPTQVLRIFDDLIGNGQSAGRLAGEICATLLKVLVLKVAETSVSYDFKGTAAFATYQTCCEYIQENCLRLQSLSEIAEACHIDEAYLCRLFKRFGDVSPYKYLMRLKMNVAAARLQSPDAMIKEVAYALGFSNPFHFSRAFKKAFGISPGAFRRLR